MKNKYENVIFYCGPEVNNTSANGLKTLFVSGFRGTLQIIELCNFNNCRAVHLGANGSFQRNKKLTEQLPVLLEQGLKVTLEYPIDAHEYVLENVSPEVLRHPNFIPLANCQITKIDSISKNFAIKFDDSHFGGDNHGTWTLSATEVMDANRFSSWEDHDNEVILLREENKKSKSTKK
jgi:hypothetical protein